VLKNKINCVSLFQITLYEEVWWYVSMCNKLNQSKFVCPMINLLKRIMTYPGLEPGLFRLAVNIPNHLGRLPIALGAPILEGPCGKRPTLYGQSVLSLSVSHQIPTNNVVTKFNKSMSPIHCSGKYSLRGSR
jgi:hypothetical protein